MAERTTQVFRQGEARGQTRQIFLSSYFLLSMYICVIV